MTTTTPRDEIHKFIRLLRKAFRHTRLVMIVGGAGLVLSVIGAIVMPRKYVSETLLLYSELIPRNVIDVPNVEDRRSAGLRMRDTLLSGAVLSRIVNEFKLYDEFEDRGGMVARVEELRKRVIFRETSMSTFRIMYTSHTPELAQNVTARLAELLIESEAAMRTEQAEATMRFLETETAKSAEIVNAREREVAEFIARYPEYAERALGPTAMAPTAAGPDPTVALRQLQQERAELAAAMDWLESPVGGRAPRTPAATPQTPEAIEDQYRQAVEHLRDVTRDLGDKHPDVLAARTRVADAEAQLLRARPELSATDVRAQNRRKTQIKKRFTEIEERIEELGRLADQQLDRGATAATRGRRKVDADREARWQTLSRESAQARTHYGLVRARMLTGEILANLTETTQAQQLKVIDPAYLPAKPSGTSRSMIVMAGGVLTAALIFMMLVVLVLLDDYVYAPADLKSAGLGTVLAELKPVEIRRRRPWTRRT